MALFSARSCGQKGVSLVEVLVVLAVIGILIALLLPAVQAARESGRQTACKNNVKQLALAMQGHLNTYRQYPSNGWGHAWVGDPDRGSGKRQPGGWIYQLLPYVEQSGLRQMGRGQPAAEKRQQATRLVQTPLGILTCPTRAAPCPSPAAPYGIYRNAEWVPEIPKNDYAVNGGDFFTESAIWQGPLTLQQGDADQYPWTDLRLFTGICYQRSEIQPAMVRDGLSQTYLIGEKYVSRPNYATYLDEGYNQSMYVGTCLDLVRWVFEPPQQDGQDILVHRFGSAHAPGCHFALCDGSVRLISYQIDPEVHRRFGNRRDGLPTDAAQY